MLRPTALLAGLLFAVTNAGPAHAQPIAVEGQPLAANVGRLLKALDALGHPLPAAQAKAIDEAVKKQDAAKLQQLLDPHVLVFVHLNPEARVKAKRGEGSTVLQQVGYTPIIIKVHNESTVTKPLRINSPQALPIASGGKTRLKLDQLTGDDIKNRFLDVAMFTAPPMTDKLSGLKVEYALAVIHSTQAGKREATLILDLGAGTADLGARADVPVLFDIKPAIPVKLLIDDFDGTPTTGRFTFKDKLGRVYPPKAKRLAPDFFFQDQVYRHSGGFVLLPPGELTMTYGRGPEYRQVEQRILVPDKGDTTVSVKLQRWINPKDYGFYSGDHHIHAAGCSHYTNPTEGVFAEDMFLHVKGEGLNVGCNLTWGPCFEFQRQFFEPTANKISEPFTVLKYDIEVSGFGSQALGHVCLLNLRDQTYPGSKGTKTQGWPTWTTPLMRWAKNQGAYTGYAHSANGLGVNPKAAAKRIIDAFDKDKLGKLGHRDVEGTLLPDTFENIDTNNDGFITPEELTFAIARVSGQIKGIPAQLPNLAIPEMDGIGAQEICVTTAQGLCDFISAMDTNRVPEWNCWYHILNCGFPLKVSGETDFPCITDSRVGQGRVYVQLGKIDRIEFKDWAEGLAKGRSYVCDGYAHALQFSVNGTMPGDRVKLSKPGKVAVKARVAFASATPLGTAQGGQLPKDSQRKVELIVNGRVIATREVSADDKEHDLSFDIAIDKSSWVALRHFPQLHTNPVEVIIDNAPIRASRQSALWCVQVIDQLWKVRAKAIAEDERADAERVFGWAKMRYQKIAEEASADVALAAIWNNNPEELARLLMTSLKEKDAVGARAFIEIAGALKRPEREHAAIVNAMNAALDSPLPEARQAAFAAVLKSDPTLKDRPALVKRVLTDKGVKVPLTFLNAMWGTKAPFAHPVSAIRAGLDHPNPEVRYFTVRLLLEYGKEFKDDADAVNQAADAVADILKDRKQNPLPPIELAARLGTKRLIPILEPLAKDKDADIRFAAIFAVWRLDNKRVPVVPVSPLHYLPSDTTAVTQVRFKDIVENALVKKLFLADIRRDAKAWSILEALGIDAVRDIHSITFTGDRLDSLLPAGFNGLMILQGDFPKTPLFKPVDVMQKGRPFFGVCVSPKLVLVSNGPGAILDAVKRGVTGTAALPPDLEPVLKKTNNRAAIWTAAAPRDKALEGDSATWSLDKGIVMGMDFLVADETTLEVWKIRAAKLGEIAKDELRDRAEQAKVDAKAIKSSVTVEDNVVRLRVEAPPAVLEMIVREMLKRN